jgi:signal transduction histidine kinase
MTLLTLILGTTAIFFAAVSLFLFTEQILLKNKLTKNGNLNLANDVNQQAAEPKLFEIAETEVSKITSLIGSLADGIFMVDSNKRLLIINKAAKSYLEISEMPDFNEILTKSAGQYEFSSKIDEVLNTNKQIEDNEIKINNKIYQIFISPVMNETKPIGASVMLHDITHEQNIAKEKEDFTHMIVHELRAPLTAMKDSSELIIESNLGPNPLSKDDETKLLKVIEMQCKSLLTQINEILDAAKIDAGSFVITKTETDLSKVIQTEIDSFTAEASKKQIILNAEIEANLPKIDADSVRIAQVITNLVSNSLKFTNEGGKITIRAKISNGAMTISVTDTGIGIPDSEKDKIFEKYYQVESTNHELAKKGTGLGLYIVKGIVEAHGGQINIISTQGQGTTISLTLPITGNMPKVIQTHSFEAAKPQFASLSVN